jgi:hypothetical protein
VGGQTAQQSLEPVPTHTSSRPPEQDPRSSSQTPPNGWVFIVVVVVVAVVAPGCKEGFDQEIVVQEFTITEVGEDQEITKSMHNEQSISQTEETINDTHLFKNAI